VAGDWLLVAGWGGERVAQDGMFCVWAVDFFEICKNEATQAEKATGIRVENNKEERGLCDGGNGSG
jgi:hypothetical protein